MDEVGALRVALLFCGMMEAAETTVWLHDDGVVEVAVTVVRMLVLVTSEGISSDRAASPSNLDILGRTGL